MRKSIGYYSRKALKDTRWGFKHMTFTDRLLLMVYIITSFVGKLLFLTRPIFTMADDQLATTLSERKPFSIWLLFEGASDRQRYGHLLVTYLVTDLFMVFGIVLIVALPLMMWSFLVPILDQLSNLLGFYHAITIFFIVLGVLYILLSGVYYSAVGFVSGRYPEASPGRILQRVHDGLRRQGRVNIFLLNLLYILTFLIAILLLSVQGSTLIFSTLVTFLGYRGFLATFIFALVFLGIGFLLLIWLFPAVYVHLHLTQHLILRDAMAEVIQGVNPTDTPQEVVPSPVQGSPQPVEVSNMDSPRANEEETLTIKKTTKQGKKK